MPADSINIQTTDYFIQYDNDDTADHLTIIPENECITIGNNCGSIRYAGKLVVDIGVLR